MEKNDRVVNSQAQSQVVPDHIFGDQDETMSSPIGSPHENMGMILVPDTPDPVTTHQEEDADSVHEWEHTPTSNASRFLRRRPSEDSIQNSPAIEGV